MRNNQKLMWVGIFAVAMAYLESAVVVYIRKIYGIQDLLLDLPGFDPLVGPVELGREIATMAMLFSIGWGLGKTLQDRIGYFIFIFGAWDIFYYFWLKVFIDWPNSLLETDLLFLIPLPWWGPVIAPMLIACLMVISGVTLINRAEKEYFVKPKISEIFLLVSGIFVMLYSFMRDAIHSLPATVAELSALRPHAFPWWIYSLGFLMAVLGIISMYGVDLRKFAVRLKNS